MFGPQQPSGPNGGPHEASSEVGKSTRPPPCKFMTLKQNMDGKMRCFLGSLLGPVGFSYDLSVSLVIPRLSNQFVFRKSRWPFNRSWSEIVSKLNPKNPLKNTEMPSENTKNTLGNGWLWVTKIKLLGSSIPLSHWQLQSPILLNSILVPKNPNINSGKCLFQNENYKNYLLPAMDIPNICIRMLDISASIKLACEHRNHPTCQWFG